MSKYNSEQNYLVHCKTFFLEPNSNNDKIISIYESIPDPVSGSFPGDVKNLDFKVCPIKTKFLGDIKLQDDDDDDDDDESIAETLLKTWILKLT